MKGGDPERWERFVRFALMAGILSLAGPEIFAAIELTLLVELLGAGLFLTAYRAAFKALAIDVSRFLGGLLLPPLPVAILRHGNPIRKAEAFIHLTGNALWCIAFAAICVAFIAHHWNGAA